MPVFTLSNSYNQLAAICNDQVNNSSNTNDESVFDMQEETGTTTVLSDSCITKDDEFQEHSSCKKYIAATEPRAEYTRNSQTRRGSGIDKIYEWEV